MIINILTILVFLFLYVVVGLITFHVNEKLHPSSLNEKEAVIFLCCFWPLLFIFFCLVLFWDKVVYKTIRKFSVVVKYFVDSAFLFFERLK